MKRTAEQSNRKKQGIGKYIDGHMPPFDAAAGLGRGYHCFHISYP